MERWVSVYVNHPPAPWCPTGHSLTFSAKVRPRFCPFDSTTAWLIFKNRFQWLYFILKVSVNLEMQIVKWTVYLQPYSIYTPTQILHTVSGDSNTYRVVLRNFTLSFQLVWCSLAFHKPIKVCCNRQLCPSY